MKNLRGYKHKSKAKLGPVNGHKGTIIKGKIIIVTSLELNILRLPWGSIIKKIRF